MLDKTLLNCHNSVFGHQPMLLLTWNCAGGFKDMLNTGFGEGLWGPLGKQLHHTAVSTCNEQSFSVWSHKDHINLPNQSCRHCFYSWLRSGFQDWWAYLGDNQRNYHVGSDKLRQRRKESPGQWEFSGHCGQLGHNPLALGEHMVQSQSNSGNESRVLTSVDSTFQSLTWTPISPMAKGSSGKGA